MAATHAMAVRPVQLNLQQALVGGNVLLADVTIRQLASVQASLSCTVLLRNALPTIAPAAFKSNPTLQLERCDVMAKHADFVILPSTSEVTLAFVSIHAGTRCHGVQLNGVAKAVLEEVLVRGTDKPTTPAHRVGVLHNGQRLRADKLSVYGFDFGIAYNVTAQEYTDLHNIVIDTCAVGLEVVDFRFPMSAFGLGALDLITVTVYRARNVSILLDGRSLLLQNAVLIDTGEIGVLVHNTLPWRRELHNTANLPAEQCKYDAFVKAPISNIVDLTVVSRQEATDVVVLMTEQYVGLWDR
jgi:hypothetical protein